MNRDPAKIHLKRIKLLKRRGAVDHGERRGIHVYVLPNLFTTGNMFFGFYSIIQSLSGNFVMAAYAVVAAALFDTLDGRVARMAQATSKFGMEYDSLSDLVSFGVAPALLLFLWALKPFGRAGWLACFLYMACGALRLARFNVQAVSLEKKYFQGLPIPMAAGIVATSVTAFDDMKWNADRSPYLLAMTILLSFVMVSTFRYRSFKEMDFKNRKPFFALIIALCIIVFVALRPEVNLFIAFISYAVLGAVLGVLSPARKRINQVLVASRHHDHSNTPLNEENKNQQDDDDRLVHAKSPKDPSHA